MLSRGCNNTDFTLNSNSNQVKCICILVLICICLVLVSSEGALIAITPYDYPQQHPLFEHTPVLDNNLNRNAMMTLVTMIIIKTEITEITRNVN